MNFKHARVPSVERVTTFVGLVLILALLLQSCTTSVSTQVPSETEPSALTTEASSSSLSETPVQTEAPDQTEDRGKIMRIAMQPLVQTDPAFISSDSEVLVANSVYDYLVDVDAKNQIIPRLATDWSISEDGLTYQFNLAEGVTFHDGSPMSAKDVVWTFDRLRDQNSDLPTKNLYANIARVESAGNLQVVFTILKPNPFFLYDLSDNHALILKAETADPSKFNGTGPFTVTNYSPEDRIEMKANKNYFVSGLPKLEGVEILFFADETAMVDALRGGQIDLTMRMSKDLYKSLEGDGNITTVLIPTNQFDLVRLRSDREPGNNPKVIQAMRLATDRQVIMNLVLQGFGAVGRDSPIGPMYSAYFSEATPLPERDVAKAKALLAEAGYEDGIKIDMHVPDTGDRPNLASVLKNQWAEAGIDVTLIVEPESVYYGENGWLEVDLGITGWGSRPYPQFYLDVMLKTGAEWNEAHYSDEELDGLIELAGTTLNEEERVQAYAEIQRILIERGPMIVPYFAALAGAISNQFVGFEMKPFPGRTDLRIISPAN
jgi:peptide/nickel transport system substrate-binding protein